MANLELLQKIKKLTISALVADDILMGILVLKGGNALNLAYDITNRGSIDIDFSMEKDFSEKDKGGLLNQFKHLLEVEFTKEELVVFDVKLLNKPNKVNDAVKSFWGGYLLEFKVISQKEYDSYNGNIDSIRINAIPLHDDHSPKFTVDISKYEYVGNKKITDIEGASVYVYSPEMIALEKLRALCQQIPTYKDVVYSMTPKSRARDFYDIYNLSKSFSIDFKTSEISELCKHIFEAKRVPLTYLKLLSEQKEFHRESWESVVNTVGSNEKLEPFDFYFDYALKISTDLI